MKRIIAAAAALLLLAGCASPPQPSPATPAFPPVPPMRTEPAPSPPFTGFTFRNETEGWAVTRSGSIHHTADGAKNWAAVQSGLPVEYNQIVPMGQQGLAAIGQKVCSPQPCTGEAVLTYSTDGTRWESVRPEGLESETLHQAWPYFRFVFPSEQVGYLAKDADMNGGFGPIETMQHAIYKTIDGGRTWQVVELPEGASSTGGITFLSAEVGFLTSGRDLLRTGDGGRTWKSVLRVEVPLHAVAFVNEQVGLAAGGFDAKSELQPRQAVWRTEDGGATWKPLFTGAQGHPIDGLWLTSPEKGWATTYTCTMGANMPCAGPLLFTADGGQTWNAVPGTQTVARFSPTATIGWYGEGSDGPIRQAEPLATAPTATSEKEQVMARGKEVLAALKTRDMKRLAELAHPELGVRFSPYAFVRVDKDQRFTPEQIRKGMDDPTVYLWGYADGSGEPIKLTFAAYLGRYGKDWVNAPVVTFNQVAKQGNTKINITDAYPNGRFVEYHFPGTEANNQFDWSSLRLVFEQKDSTWYLVGVIHDQWTI